MSSKNTCWIFIDILNEFGSVYQCYFSSMNLPLNFLQHNKGGISECSCRNWLASHFDMEPGQLKLWQIYGDWQPMNKAIIFSISKITLKFENG